MTSTVPPIEAEIREICADLDRALAACRPWQNPTEYSGLVAGSRAALALGEVTDALADLDPAAALIVTDAIEKAFAAATVGETR